MFYLNNAKPHLFSEENTNIGDKSHFTVLGKFTFLNFHREIILFLRALLAFFIAESLYFTGVAKGVEPAPGSLLPLNGVGRAYGRQNVP